MAEDVRWCPVMVVACGPEADVAESLAAIGAAKPCAEAGPILEDGQLHLATSGFCLWEKGTVAVLTSATLLAPFLRRRLGALVASHRVDPQLVATTELFVVFPGQKPLVAEASLAACLPLPAEPSLQLLQAALDASPKEELPWRPPVVGNLGVALLRITLPEGLGPGRPMAWPSDQLQVGQRLRIMSSAFGLLKASIFLGAETQCTVAAADQASGLLLLDGRWLPGCEGGVALTEEGQPCALLAAPLRSDRGSRWTLCPGIALRGILTTVLQSLAAHVLPRSLQDSTFPKANFGAGWCWPTGIAMLDDGHEVFGCVLLSERHMLLSAGLSRPTDTACLHTELGKVHCRVQLLQAVESLGLVLAELQFQDQAPAAIRWPGADVDLQEGQDLIAIDLVGPKLAKGVLQCWLGARHHPSAPPALECALPSQGLNHAHVFFEARTNALFGIALDNLKTECHSSDSNVRVLPVRCHGVSVFQLKELQQCLNLRSPEVNSAMVCGAQQLRRWVKSFDARWMPMVSGTALEWRLEARPFAATSAL